MLTSFLSEYLAQLFNVTIRVCCSTKYRKHNCVLQPEKLKGAFQGRNCVIYKYRAIEKNVNQGYLETKYLTIDILIFIFQPGKIHFVLKVSPRPIIYQFLKTECIQCLS